MGEWAIAPVAIVVVVARFAFEAGAVLVALVVWDRWLRKG